MQRGERDLARPDQVEVVVGEAVDLLLGVGQEAGAEERLLAHQHRRDHRLEACAAQQLERPADERELEQHELALQVGEARARHARGARPCRSRCRRARGGRGRVRPASPTSRDDRRPRRRRVGSGRLGSAASTASSSASTAASSLARAPSAAGDLAHRARSPRRRPRPPAWRRRSPRRLVLLGAQRLELGQQLAPLLVEREHLVELRASAPRRASAARTASGSLADRLEVEHGAASLAWPLRRGRSPAALARQRVGPRGCFASLPEQATTNSATFSASSPTTMFWGMIAPEKPPLRIA